VAAAAAASVFVCTALDLAHAGGLNSPSFMLFAGTDLWRYGAFFYGGTLWCRACVDTDGFTLKLLLNGGDYSYRSGDLNTDVSGRLLSAAVTRGWRFSRDNLSVCVFAGPLVQDYRLSPDDPDSRLRGFYVGGQFATEVWYQPTVNTMAAVNGTLAAIGPTGSLRGALGVRLFDAMFVGPEALAHWCANFQQFEFGAHVTAFRVNAFEWSAAGGFAVDSERRIGPYLRVGVSTKF